MQDRFRLAAALSAALLASPAAMASEAATIAPLPMTYGMFEAAVPHADLESCPDVLAGDGRFCRLVMNHHELHVFAFAEAGEQPMVGYHSWPEQLLNMLLD